MTANRPTDAIDHPDTRDHPDRPADRGGRAVGGPGRPGLARASAGLLTGILSTGALLIGLFPAPRALHAGALAQAETCAIAGKVLLQGRGTHAGIQVAADAGEPQPSAGSGYFELDGLAPGEHRLQAAFEGFLTARAEAVPCRAGHTTRMLDFELRGGDITRDDAVDLFDLVRLGRAYGTCAEAEGFDRQADLNQSGCVDLFDLVLVGSAYGLRGPQVWPLPSGRFNTEILPIMRRYCTSCHGTVAGLRLDSYAATMAGGRDGPVVVPGDPGASALYLRLRGEGGQPMPPGGVQLESDEIAVIRDWIAAGAPEN